MEVLGMVGNGILAGVTAVAGLGGPQIEHNPNTTVAPIVSPHNTVNASPQTTVNPTFQPTTQQNPTLNSVFSPQINVFNGTSQGSVTSPTPSIKNGDQPLNATAPITQTTNTTQPPPPTPETPPNFLPTSKPRPRLSLPQACIATGICITTLLYNFTRMRKLELFLQDAHNRWFSWKSDVPVETFARTPRIQLVPELISAVQKHYLSTRTMQDFVSPLKVFLNDLDQEKKALKQLLWYCKIIRTLRIGGLFGINSHYLEKAEEGLIRLAYIKHIFTAWCAEFRVDMNNFRLPAPKSQP